MNRDDLVAIIGAVGYLGILTACGYAWLMQGDSEARTTLIALASPSVFAGGFVMAHRTAAIAAAEVAAPVDTKSN